MRRTGDAVGAGGLILLDESTDPYGVEAVRASMGAIFTQKLVSARWDDFLAWLRAGPGQLVATWLRSEEHTSELQSLMRISYAVFCLKKKINTSIYRTIIIHKSHNTYTPHTACSSLLLFTL